MRDLAGDANFLTPASLIGDQTRARILLALLDARALPMTMLAAEAGVAPSTVSSHLTQLVDGGLLTVRQQGRHRYYSLASAKVAHALESLADLAPPFTPRSLRSGTRASALRLARTCYDHLAGHLGVGLMQALLERKVLIGGDGLHDPDRSVRDRLSAPGRDLTYEVTDDGWHILDMVGVRPPCTTRPTVRYCVDWTEQRHHLAGAVGAALLDRLLELGWVVRASGSRVIRVPEEGARGLRDWLDLDVQELRTRAAA
ncbi:ArsR/SmtB family transcription factor [Streptomyces caeruleatus]|uniref:ArsR family transcriptional regulator n=1 Tax=Streptomyces caeruleatus TaxID=661399 RepID=A0A117RL50_9ACTN|nr:helix-turn-helix domain-containing protein [Streptomyces caeruleatus]KUN96763.1 ArsR family transcriptional regulator [Streptomyces caeruleatus]